MIPGIKWCVVNKFGAFLVDMNAEYLINLPRFYSLGMRAAVDLNVPLPTLCDVGCNFSNQATRNNSMGKKGTAGGKNPPKEGGQTTQESKEGKLSALAYLISGHHLYVRAGCLA